MVRCPPGGPHERSKLLALAILTACSQASPPPNPPPAPPPAPAPLPTVEARNVPPPASAPPPAPTPRAVEQSAYGKIDGKVIWLFTLTNQHGLTVKITNFGATVTALLVPDRSGKLADFVLGYEKAEGYAAGSVFLGATIGRNANRIRDAKFKLEGKEYALAPNDKPHNLHGGTTGWSKRIWDAVPAETPAGPALKLTYVSKDGEEGYPGTVTATTTYTLTSVNHAHCAGTDTGSATHTNQNRQAIVAASLSVAR